ncbi:hypothetical protein K8Q94_02675 [Candidatus Nomurabacteria bacterium]|nr:hypothetical protein [Candidatus Nomurabacteria bacterium]
MNVVFRKINYKFFAILVFAFCCFIFSAHSAAAACTKYWIGGGTTTSWTASPTTNWAATSGGTIRVAAPGSTDDVCFDGVGTTANADSVVSSGITIQSLTFSGYTGSFSSSTNLINISLNSSVNMLVVDNNVQFGTTLFRVNGTVTATAGAHVSNVSLDFRPGVTVNTNGAVWGSFSSNNANPINLSSDLTTSGNFNATGNATFSGAKNVTIGGNLVIGAITFSIANATLTVTGTTTITGAGGNFTDSNVTGTNTFIGTVTVNSGAIFNISANSPCVFRGGLTNNTTSTFQSGSGSWTFDTNAQTISGTQSFTITNLTNNVTTGTGLTFSGTQPTVTTLTQGTNAILTFTGSSLPTITTLTASASGNTVVYSNSSAVTAMGISYVNLTNNITTSTGLTMTSSASATTVTQGTSAILTFSGTVPTITTLTATATGNTVQYTSTSSQTIKSATYYSLTKSGAGGTATLGGAVTVNGDLTISSGTLDVSVSNYQISLGGNWSNSGTFTARSGTVLLSGSVQQTISGTLTSSSAFYNLTITNNSGSDASDDERTGFTPSIIFSASMTSTGTYTITTASVRVQYLSGGTYTFNNINFNGQASGTKIFFRNSAVSGTWSMCVSGTQTAVSYVNVSRSDASCGNAISSDGTDYDGSNNTNWFGISISGTADGNNGATVKVAVNGTLSGTSTTISGGTWTLASVTAVSGDIVTVYVDGVSNANESTAITKQSSGAITGMVLNTGVLSIGSNQNTSLTITNLSSYTSSNDEDVMQSVSSSILSVQGTGNSYTNPTLSILSGNTLSVGTSEGIVTGKINIAGTLTSTGNASYTLDGTSGTLFTRTGTFTQATSTVTLSGNGDATINSGTTTFYNLTSSGTGVKSVSGSSALTFASSGTLTVSAGTFDPLTALVASGSNTLDVTGTIRVEASTFAGSYPSGFSTVNLNSGSTVDYYLSGTQTISSTITPYYNLTVSTGGTKTLGGNLTVSNVLTIGSGATLSGSSHTLTLSGTTGTPFVNSGTFTASTGTVSYTGNYASGNTTIIGETYYNLVINNASETYLLGGTTAIDTSGTLTITDGVLDLTNQNFTNNGTTSVSGTLSDNSATGSNTFIGTVTINSGGIWLTTNNPSFVFQGGLTNNSSSGFTSGSGTYTFGNHAQNLNGSQAYTITNVANYSTVSTGLSLTGQYPSITTLTQSTNSILTISGTVPSITTLTATATDNYVKYTSTSSQNIKNTTYYNLTKSGAGGMATLAGNTIVNNILSIASGTLSTGNYNISISDLDLSGGTFSGGSSTITVIENWTNTGGTFIAGTSSVLLNGNISSQITGTNTFYNLIITSTVAKTINFSTSGINTVTHLFTVTGNLGELISLHSASSGTHWPFRVTTGTVNISYVDVQDGGCSSGAINMIPVTSTNSGNNQSCWSFFSLTPYVYKLTNGNTVEVYTNTNTPSLVKTIQLAGDYATVQPTSFSVDSNFGKLYVTTTDTSAELQIVDISDPSVSNWAYSSSVDLSINSNTSVDAKDIYVDNAGTAIVLGSAGSVGGVIFIDTSNNTDTETHSISSTSDLVFANYEYSGSYNGNDTSGYVYVYNYNTSRLYVYPYFSNGTTLQVSEEINTLSGYGSPTAMSVHALANSSLYLLFAGAPQTIYFFPVNFSSPENVTLSPDNNVSVGVTINDISTARISGSDYAYIAGADGLYKISNFSSPSVLHTDTVGNGLSSVSYDSDSGYVYGVSNLESTLYDFNN